MTNRDLYEIVNGFADQFGSGKAPALEEYLRSLWWVVSQSQPSEPTPELLAEWLEAAFTTEPPAFDPAWRERHRQQPQESADFSDWENGILFQIADLRRMAEAGQLEDEFRYFGITSPSGNLWYNFNPVTYLECGVAGTFGGYAADERIILIPAPEGESDDSPIWSLERFTWLDFLEFLECCRLYE